MEQSLPLIIIGIIIGITLGYFVAKLQFFGKIRSQRKNAVERSKHVLMGQVNEKIAPILPNFPYNYKDLVFIGKGIDYLVFDGLSTGNLKEIVFLEVKSGISNLNRNERMIKECISRGKTSYDILRIKR